MELKARVLPFPCVCRTLSGTGQSHLLRLTPSRPKSVRSSLSSNLCQVRKVFVGGIPQDFTQDDLCVNDLLVQMHVGQQTSLRCEPEQELFSQFGAVTKAIFLRREDKLVLSFEFSIREGLVAASPPK